MSDHEGYPQPDRLVGLLNGDFNLEEARERYRIWWPSSDRLPQGGFIGSIREELGSLDSRLLYDTVWEALSTAQITHHFKDYIALTVVDAFEHNEPVSDDIAPARLGLDDPDGGIFNPERAPVIEVGFLRAWMQKLGARSLRTDVGENGETRPVVSEPEYFKDAMINLMLWSFSWRERTAGKDPFEGLDVEPYMEVLRQLQDPEVDIFDYTRLDSDFYNDLYGDFDERYKFSFEDTDPEL